VEFVQVCALLGGGGHAEKVNVPAGQVFPIPKGVSLQDAAGIPEVACTVWSTIFMSVHLTKGETLLVQNPSTRQISWTCQGISACMVVKIHQQTLLVSAAYSKCQRSASCCFNALE
jgi:hypothetical protein